MNIPSKQLVLHVMSFDRAAIIITDINVGEENAALDISSDIKNKGSEEVFCLNSYTNVDGCCL